MEKLPKHDGKFIPIEIIHDILLDLPVKTLKRFLCVSKPWQSLISDPAFQRDHYCRGSQHDPLLLLTNCDVDESTDPGILHLSTCTGIDGTPVDKWSTPVQENVVPIQSCQGLICLTELETDTEILICNPATREIFAVPPGNGDSISVGFGYVDSTKEFKVVRFFYRYGSYDDGSCYNSLCEVFTLGSSDWREAREPPAKFPQSSWPGGAPFVNGSIHLLPDSGLCAGHVVHSFHIQSGEYNTIQLPKYCYKAAASEPTNIMTIQELRGSLYLIFSFETSIRIWLLEDYENVNWVQKYKINLTPVGYRASDHRLVILGDGTILLTVASEGLGELLYCYNPRDKSFTRRSGDGCKAIMYVESFLPVGSIA